MAFLNSSNPTAIAQRGYLYFYYRPLINILVTMGPAHYKALKFGAVHGDIDQNEDINGCYH